MLLPLLLIAALSPAQNAPSPAAPVDVLGFDGGGDFKLGYHARNETSDITELVIPPETVENWTTLITQQTLFDGAQRAGLERFYGLWRDMMRRDCPGLTDTVEQGTVEGMPAIKGMLSCPNNPQTGKPENLSAVLVQGDVNLLMIQIAFRRPIDARDAALIRRVNGSLRICAAVEARCVRRKDSGFTPTVAK